GKALFPDATPGFEPPQTVSQLIVLVLNAGNLGNLERLLKGRGITKAQIEAALAQHLDKATMDWIQSIWDAAEAMWPDARKMHERVTGMAPSKVAAEPIQTPWGTYRGGYFPLRYRYE